MVSEEEEEKEKKEEHIEHEGDDADALRAQLLQSIAHRRMEKKDVSITLFNHVCIKFNVLPLGHCCTCFMVIHNIFFGGGGGGGSKIFSGY